MPSCTLSSVKQNLVIEEEITKMFIHQKLLKLTALITITIALTLSLATTLYAVEAPAPKKVVPPPKVVVPSPRVVVPQPQPKATAEPVEEELSCDPNAKMYNGVDVNNVIAGAAYTDPTAMRLHITCDTPVIGYMHSNSILKIYLAKGLKMTETSIDVLNQAREGEITIPTEDGIGTVTLKPFQYGILSVSVIHPTYNDGMSMESKILWGHNERQTEF